MMIETEKNDASGSTIIDENRGRDDACQNPKKRGASKDVVESLDKRVAGVETSMTELKNQVEGLEGWDSNFTGMREDFQVALNTLSGDLKREIHDLRDSFMGEIMKILEKFGEEIHKLKQPGTIREYVNEFTTLVLETPELSDQDSLFYFLDGLQGWAKMELERRGVQDLSTSITHAEAMIDFSTKRESSKPKDRKVNQEKSGGEKNSHQRARDYPKKASLNGLSAHEDEYTSDGESMDDEAKWIGITATKGSGTIKAVNSSAKPIQGVAKNVMANIREWEGTIDLSVVPMDDFKVALGLEFLDKVRAFPMPFANSLCILDGGKTCMVSTKRDAKSGAKTVSAMQFKKGFNKSEPCYLAVTRLETDELIALNILIEPMLSPSLVYSSS
nr:hypothetical protein [Tanacetum cinerariifolium]